MNKFVRNLITEWRKLELPLDTGTVVIAISGGADSSALLAAMADLRDRQKLRLQLIAAHFDHGLRGEASLADKAFVERLAAELKVAFSTGTGRIYKRGNLEQNARNARYKFLHETATAAGGALVLTGHTLNDQAETFLLNLIRGSGPDGLSAMYPVRQLDESGDDYDEKDAVQLVRPLLRWAKREDTEAFCRGMSIDFRRDEMNQDPAFSRVRVRKYVIPLLKEFNPKIIDTLCSTAERMRELSPPKQTGFTDTLPISDLAALSEPELFRTVRAWLAVKRGSLRGISAKHIEAVHRLILSRRSGKTVELPGRQTVTKQGGRLVFASIMVEK